MLLKWIERYFSLEKTGEGEYLTECCFHDDDKPSLSVNVKKKLFHCHACGESGNIPKLFARVTGFHEELVRYELNFLQQMEWKLPDYNPLHYQNRLIQAEMLGYLIRERHWSSAVIEEAKIGWDGVRVQIPVINIFGDIVNIRKYKVRAGPDDYKVINEKGFGKARLYGVRNLRDSPKNIVLTEGEPDTLAAQSLGYVAVCSTAGAKTFNPGWTCAFAKVPVYVFYDGDEAGVGGARKAASILRGSGTDARIVAVPDAKDFTDLVHGGATAEDFEGLFNTAVVLDQIEVVESEDEEVHEVSLSESSDKAYYRKKVKLRVMVSGKTLAPYIVPEEVQVGCTLPELKMCGGCGLQLNGGKDQLKFTSTTPELLQLVETSIDTHPKIFREMCGIPSRCKIVQFDVVKAQNVEETKVTPNLDFSDDESQYVIRQVYYMGHGLQSNVPYEIVGLTIPHPKTQQVTYLSDYAIPLEDTVSAFKVTDDLIARLRIFSLNGTDPSEVKRDLS